MIRRQPRQRIGQVSTGKSIPAPTRGWNARDNIAEMDPLDAYKLVNWFPGTTSVNLRKGYDDHATNFTGQCESLLVYNGASANSMWGFVGTEAFNVTSSGAVGAAALTGLTNARWQSINVATTAGKYLMAVNGADKAAFYTGSAWARDGDGAPYDITGVDTRDCIQINLFKTQVWLVQESTLTAWYLPAGQIGGAATAFRLNGIAKLGGYLMWMATWTIDGGQGIDDLAVFATSQGEIIVYKGTDPSSIATWALVGVWATGAPIGRRSFLSYEGDLLIITKSGVISMSALMRSSSVRPLVPITDRIQSAMASAATSYSGNFGWELVHFDAPNQLYLNVPVMEGADQQQYVMNTITKAWCNFTGWEANCFAVLNDELYFGGNNVVYKAWTGLTDNGDDIQGFGLQAFNYFGDRAYNKRFVAMIPTLFTNGAPSLFGTINTNFNISQPTAPLSFSATTYGTWDGAGATSQWDNAVWGDDLSPQENLQGVTNEGVCGAPTLMASASGIEVQWASTSVVFERATGTLLR